METRVEADPKFIVKICERAVAAIDRNDPLSAKGLILTLAASAKVVIALQDTGAPGLSMPWEDGIPWSGR